MPVIPAPWEATAGGFQVQVQPGQLSKTLSLNEKIQEGWGYGSE